MSVPFDHRPTLTHRGFTLIEVVIVLSIIAILALMAIPSLMGQTAKNQIKESIPLMDLAKGAVASYYQRNGKFPEDNDKAKLPKAEKIIGSYVTGVAVKDGAVTMSFGNSANAKIKDKKLTVRPAFVPDEPRVPVSWVCAARPAPKDMELAGKDQTDVPGDALPVECR